MINAKFFQEILERKRTNTTELKDAPFFEIEKNGHVAYLLGTDHMSDLSTLPEFILMHIKQADQLFIEQGIPTDKEFCDFLETVRIKQTEQIWDKVLTAEELQLFRKMVAEAFAIFASGLQEFPFDPLELEPSFLMHIVNAHIACIVEKIQVNPNGNESEVGKNPIMDAELAALFDDRTIPLEPDHSSVRVDEFDEYALETLKETFLPFYRFSSENLENLSTNDREAFLKLRSKLVSVLQEEKKSYDVHFMKDFSREVELDNELQNNDLKMVNSNLVMFNSIDKSIANHRKPLYAVGADHLIGSVGLLNILHSQGYKVSKVVSEECTQPIQYLYKQYLSSYNAIKQDILKHPSRNATQPLLLRPLLETHDLIVPSTVLPYLDATKPRLLLKMQ